METHSLDLYFVQPNTGSLPHGPQATICIKTCTSSSGTDSLKHITPDCVIFEELNTQIDILIKELEDIRKVGRKKFLKSISHRAKK